MGLKNSKKARTMMVQKTKDTKLTATKGPDSSTGTHSYLTVKPAGDDDYSLGGMYEHGFVVPRSTDNICGVFLETLVITAPIDDPMPRDLAIFSLFNYDSPEDKMLAYIARPEVSKRDAKESFTAMLDVLLKVQAVVKQEENYNFPTPVVAGRVKRLYFGAETFQQAEHDPEWRGRLVIIVSMPYNGVFISALLALSPTGLIPTWLALVVGLGLVNVLGELHKIGFIHRYVTPWNFMLPTPFSINDIVYGTMCVDFSLATKWVEKRKKDKEEREDKVGAVQFVGTQKYSTKRAMTRHNQGPADDFLSAIFIVAELISGKLPWRAVKDNNACIMMKQNFHLSTQFKRLPREIRAVYHNLYRTYGLKRADRATLVRAFKSALQRKKPEWKTEELPAFLSMPFEDN